jgi:hypothetical protein
MKTHIAISVKDIETSIEEYNKFLKCSPVLIVKNEYALWRTKEINLSLRKTDEHPGVIRHIGFESEKHKGFNSFTDSNGVLWELFDKEAQAKEINDLWDNANYHP